MTYSRVRKRCKLDLSISDVPDEVILTELAPRLVNSNVRDASHAAQTCKRMHALFANDLQKSGAARLLQAVTYSDWEKVEQIIAVNPHFMLQVAKGKDICGNEIVMSPLQYACYLGDRFSMGIFQQHAHDELQLEMEKQINQQNTHVDLAAYRTACDAYKAQYDEWVAGNLTNEQIAKQWVDLVGRAQLKLPRHLLIQMCLSGMDVSSKVTPPTKYESMIMDPHDGCRFQVLVGLPNAKLGVNFAVIRGNDAPYATADFWGGEPARINLYSDLENLSTLLAFNIEKCQQVVGSPAVDVSMKGLVN